MAGRSRGKVQKRVRAGEKGELALRERISILKAGGMLHEEIAIAVNLSCKELELRFKEDLATARARVRAQIIEVVHASAMKGSPAAQKFFLAGTELLPPAQSPKEQGAKPVGAAPAPGEPQPRLGKKELAQREAETAAEGTSWGELVKH